MYAKVMRFGHKETIRILIFGVVSSLIAVNAPFQAAEEDTFFETKIRPVLVDRCSTCHGDKLQMASLKLTTAEGFFKGADSGPIVVEGDPEKSRIVQVVSYQDKIKMPPTGKLKDDEIEALKVWIKRGAPWPDAKAAAESHTRQPGKHWAFQPIQDGPVP